VNTSFGASVPSLDICGPPRGDVFTAVVVTTTTWTTQASEEFLQGMSNLATRRYRNAMDDLETAVVKRILELDKLNTDGVCESPYSHPKYGP
jgi:hypothetical protein